jgi:hypothetical protein
VFVRIVGREGDSAARAVAEDRDKRFHVSTAGQRRKRADIAERPVVKGANAWQSGTSVQLTLAEVQVKKT